MGEGLVAPTEAESLVILDVVEVQKNLLVTLQEVMPSPAAAAANAAEEALIEGLTIESSAVSTKTSEAAVMEYVSQMAAHLVVYDTLPTVPLNGVTGDAWKYALATTETGQWKGQSMRLFSFFTQCVCVLIRDEFKRIAALCSKSERVLLIFHLSLSLSNKHTHTLSL